MKVVPMVIAWMVAITRCCILMYLQEALAQSANKANVTASREGKIIPVICVLRRLTILIHGRCIEAGISEIQMGAR